MGVRFSRFDSVNEICEKRKNFCNLRRNEDGCHLILEKLVACLVPKSTISCFVYIVKKKDLKDLFKQKVTESDLE